mmetsp:Transcript_24799/g.84862  ORF Transcript_24799/g.84862 Transcript_24799/m.84862 type:complete len:448 (+) Transcript_24799:1785-3128(+)
MLPEVAGREQDHLLVLVALEHLLVDLVVEELAVDADEARARHLLRPRLRNQVGVPVGAQGLEQAQRVLDLPRGDVYQPLYLVRGEQVLAPSQHGLRVQRAVDLHQPDGPLFAEPKVEPLGLRARRLARGRGGRHGARVRVQRHLLDRLEPRLLPLRPRLLPHLQHARLLVHVHLQADDPCRERRPHLRQARLGRVEQHAVRACHVELARGLHGVAHPARLRRARSHEAHGPPGVICKAGLQELRRRHLHERGRVWHRDPAAVEPHERRLRGLDDARAPRVGTPGGRRGRRWRGVHSYFRVCGAAHHLQHGLARPLRLLADQDRDRRAARRLRPAGSRARHQRLGPARAQQREGARVVARLHVQDQLALQAALVARLRQQQHEQRERGHRAAGVREGAGGGAPRTLPLHGLLRAACLRCNPGDLAVIRRRRGERRGPRVRHHAPRRRA